MKTKLFFIRVVISLITRIFSGAEFVWILNIRFHIMSNFFEKLKDIIGAGNVSKSIGFLGCTSAGICERASSRYQNTPSITTTKQFIKNSNIYFRIGNLIKINHFKIPTNPPLLQNYSFVGNRIVSVFEHKYLVNRDSKYQTNSNPKMREE